MNTRSVQRALNSIMGGRPTEGRMDHGEPMMRIGGEYQAEVPGHSQEGDSQSKGTGSVLVWAPHPGVRGEDLDGFLKLAKEQFGYGTEQALGLLYWHKYNLEKAIEDLPNFCPLQDEWTMEDKVTFEQAFQYHGKNFQRIRAMLPDKPVSSLVKYYYLWKRSYSHYSLMDKHAKKNIKRIIAGLPANNDDTDSNKSGSSRSETQQSFHQYPPTLFLTGKGKQLPRGIHLSTPEMASLASDIDHTHLNHLDKEILELKEQIQSYKQALAMDKEQLEEDSLEHLRPSTFTRKPGLPTKWTDDEIQQALEVIQHHGKDYEALATALGNKSISQCRNFFTNYKRKLNLPKIIADFEIRHGVKRSRYSRQAMAREDIPENGSITGEGGSPEDFFGQTELGVGSMDSHTPSAKRPRYNNGSLEISDGVL